MQEIARTRGPLRLAADGSPAAQDLVTGVIGAEHRTLRIVLAILLRLLHEAAEFGADTDFAMLCAILYYIDEFPEQVHHPKEERHLFPALRRRTARFDSAIERLQEEHVRSAHMLARIERDLVHYQAGAAGGLPRLLVSVSTYADLLDGHMKAEEGLLVEAGNHLTEQDWSALAAAFGRGSDPLSCDTPRREFRRLRARIVNALPSKMRLDAESSEAMRGPDAD